MDNPSAFPIAVVGAGASGLMAAVAAARTRPHSVLLLEKEARVGRKLLATGNGRCNLLNRTVQEARYHGSGVRAAMALLADTPPDRLLSLFEDLGLCWREEAEGRVYPYSGQAGAVLDVLRAACDRAGVSTRCGAEVVHVTREKGRFVLDTAQGESFGAQRVILAAGGKAAPSLGANGGAYRLARALGHSVTPLFPALAPLKLPAESVRGLKGVRAHCTLTLFDEEKPLRIERGEALFTEYGVSGVAAMQLARLAGRALSAGRQAALSVSLMDESKAKTQADRRAALFEGEAMETFFTGLLHKRIGLCLLRQAGIAPTDPVSPALARRVLPLLSDWRLPVLGVLPFEHAQVTAGGVPLQEVDGRTLESNLVPGLYLCGETLDVDGDCGGYNLMWAWASGLVAGTAAAKGGAP